MQKKYQKGLKPFGIFLFGAFSVLLFHSFDILRQARTSDTTVDINFRENEAFLFRLIRLGLKFN